MSLRRSSRIGLLAALAATMLGVYGFRSVAYRRWLGARGAGHPPAAAKRELKPKEVDPALFRPNPAPFAAVRTEKGGIRTPEPRAKALVWGRDPDEFGGIPDAEGFYSQKLHFDLSASDPIRRAQFLLERNARGELELLLSKQDLEKMPTLDQVLQRVEGPAGTVDSAISYSDPLVPPFREVAGRVPGSNDGWQVQAVLRPPVDGFLLQWSSPVQDPENDDAYEGPFRLEAMDAVGNSILWRAEVPYCDRLEFSPVEPDLFYCLGQFLGGGVFSIAKGLRCPLPPSSANHRGHYAAWPTFMLDGKSLAYGFGDRIEALDLSNCTARVLGQLELPNHVGDWAPAADSVFVSGDGLAALVLARDEIHGPAAPNGNQPFRASYVSLSTANSASPLRTTAIAFGRLFNDLLQIGGTKLVSVPSPFLVVNQLRSWDGAADRLGRKQIDPFVAQYCFFLVRNRLGQFFMLATPRDSQIGMRVNRQAGLVRYDGVWWDLKPLASPSPAEDLSR
ncbi:MAG: hypothetical protein U0X73_06290 [Thermoanaerobaculia bacterium]